MTGSTASHAKLLLLTYSLPNCGSQLPHEPHVGIGTEGVLKGFDFRRLKS